MPDHDFGDLFQLFIRHDGTGRIVREGQHQDLRRRCDLCFQIFRSQLEQVLFLQFQRHRNTVRQDDAGFVGHIAGLRDNDLVPLIQKGAESEVDALGAAYRDHDLGGRIIADAESALQILCHLSLQFRKAGVAGVESASVLQGVDALFPDGPGRVKVRLAHAEGDGAFHGRHDIKEFPDARGLQPYDLFGKQFVSVSHGVIICLSSSLVSPITVP